MSLKNAIKKVNQDTPETVVETSSQLHPHVIVEALPGSGKTTTLCEGLRNMMGENPSITPSEEQRAIWDAMELSKGVKSIGFVAFSKTIAKELSQRVPEGVDTSTVHSLGMSTLIAKLDSFPAIENEEPGSQATKTHKLIECYTRKPVQWLYENGFGVQVNAVIQLVSLCKSSLLEGTPEQLDELAFFHEIDLNGSRDKIIKMVPEILKLAQDISLCKKLSKNGRSIRIDYNDMIWLPHVLNLMPKQYDLLLYDEVQDANAAQQALAMKAGRRLILVGDPNQAIFGFAGAMANSINIFEEKLNNTDAGVMVLPMNTTFRCSKAVVAECQRIAPKFVAHNSNSEGSVENMTLAGEKDYSKTVEKGDMVLCRANAPLVSQCFHILAQGKSAYIRGRNVGRGLKTLVAKSKCKDLPSLITYVETWEAKELEKEKAKRNASERRMQTVKDKAACIMSLVQNSEDIKELRKNLDNLFSDGFKKNAVVLSTIHKAKGLEAKNVFVLDLPECPVVHPKTPPHRMEEARCVQFVALSRAIERLVIVS